MSVSGIVYSLVTLANESLARSLSNGVDEVLSAIMNLDTVTRDYLIKFVTFSQGPDGMRSVAFRTPRE